MEIISIIAKKLWALTGTKSCVTYQSAAMSLSKSSQAVGIRISIHKSSVWIWYTNESGESVAPKQSLQHSAVSGLQFQVVTKSSRVGSGS